MFVTLSPRLSRASWLRLLLMAIVALCVSVAPRLAHASDGTGSWQKSCKNQVIDKTNLVVSGDCGIGGNLGLWAPTYRHSILVRFDLCIGDIANAAGHIQCSKQGAWNIPNSASQTCQGGFASNGQLWAKCRKKNGNWIWSEANGTPSSCPTAANLDGQLVCSGGVPPPITFAACVSNNAGSVNVNVTGTDFNDASAKYRQTHPGSYLLSNGPCH